MRFHVCKCQDNLLLPSAHDACAVGDMASLDVNAGVTPTICGILFTWMHLSVFVLRYHSCLLLKLYKGKC